MYDYYKYKCKYRETRHESKNLKDLLNLLEHQEKNTSESYFVLPVNKNSKEIIPLNFFTIRN